MSLLLFHVVFIFIVLPCRGRKITWTQELWTRRENVKLHLTDAKAYMLFILRPLPASQWGLEGSSPSEGEARSGEEISLRGLC